MSKSSIHFDPVKHTSEAHNLRQVKLDYNYPDLQKDNKSFVVESIENRLKEIKSHCKKVSGRKLQKNAQPIKEAVVNLKPDTSMDDLKNLAAAIKDKFKVECFQIHIHRDEGHKNDQGELVINHHAHMLFDWQNKEKGTTMKFNRLHLSQMQTLVAETLQMERGERRVNSNRDRLTPIEYKADKAQERFMKLQEQNDSLEQKKNEVRARIEKLEEERARDAPESTETALKRFIFSPYEVFYNNRQALHEFSEESLNRAIETIKQEIQSIETGNK